MTRLGISESHLTILEKLVCHLSAEPDILHEMKESETSYRGKVVIDSVEAAVSIALQSSGKVEEVSIVCEAVSGATDYFVGHQGMERFVLTTHEVVWDAWVDRNHQISDKFFALRTQMGELWVEAQYRGGLLLRIAIVDPNLYTGYAKLFFERSGDGSSFLVKPVDESLLSVTYSTDNSPVSYNWAPCFIENDFRFTYIHEDVLRFYSSPDCFIDIPVNFSNDLTKARNAILHTASLLRQISLLVNNNTPQTT